MESLKDISNNQIGQRITYLLSHNRMTQRELADRACITPVSLSRYINGARIPNSKALARIAIALNTDTDYLLGIEKESDDPEKDFYKAHRLIARSVDSWTQKQKTELILTIMGTEK